MATEDLSALARKVLEDNVEAVSDFRKSAARDVSTTCNVTCRETAVHSIYPTPSLPAGYDSIVWTDPDLREPLLLVRSTSVLDKHPHLRSKRLPVLDADSWASWQKLSVADKVEAYADRLRGLVVYDLRRKLELKDPPRNMFKPGYVFRQGGL